MYLRSIYSMLTALHNMKVRDIRSKVSGVFQILSSFVNVFISYVCVSSSENAYSCIYNRIVLHVHC